MANASYSLSEMQASGGRFVTETITDDFGVTSSHEYYAYAGTDYSAVMTARAARLLEERARAEIAGNINAIKTRGSQAQLVFLRTARADNVPALWEAWYGANIGEAILIADYLVSQTDAQLLVDGLTQAQIDNLRSGASLPPISEPDLVRAVK